jgi:hypothetical protein
VHPDLTTPWCWILAFLPYRIEDACLPFEFANSVYQFTGSCVCHFIVIDCRKVELRWDWLRCVMFVPSLVKICRRIQELTLALARITVMTQVFNRLRRESGPINVKQFPLINRRCGGIDASQVCAQLDMIYLSTAIGLTLGGSGTVHIYTQTIHRTTQLTTKQYE